MKKYLLSISCLLVSIFAFTSCDDDVTKSIVISGEWRGDFGMYYTYWYDNEELTFDSYDTYIEFIPAYDYATYGYGKQVDYYDYGPYEYQYYYFDWEIQKGVIYLTYRNDHNLGTQIHDYHLNNDVFSGLCEGATSRFKLYKLTDYYDWSEYDGYYSCYDRDLWWNEYPYFKSATRSAEEPANHEGYIIKRGNRMVDQK